MSSYSFNCQLYKDDQNLTANPDSSWTQDLYFQLSLGHCSILSLPAFLIQPVHIGPVTGTVASTQ